MNDRTVELLLELGYPVLALVLAGAALGLPLPASLMLIGAGAFASTGEMRLSTLLLSGVTAVVTGDVAGYWLGRRGGDAVVARLGGRLRLSEERITTSRRFFERWGGLTVLLTRFLIPPLGPPVNIVAGTEHYPFRSFLLYDVIGEVIWVVLYVALGYAFGMSASPLAGLLGNISTALALLALVAVVVVLLFRQLSHRYHHRLLRSNTLQPGTESGGESGGIQPGL